MAVKPAAALKIKLLYPMFLSNVTSLCVRFPKSDLMFIYERYTFPSTVAFTFCVSLLCCTQLTRPGRNYESYKCPVWPATQLCERLANSPKRGRPMDCHFWGSGSSTNSYVWQMVEDWQAGTNCCHPTVTPTWLFNHSCNPVTTVNRINNKCRGG